MALDNTVNDLIIQGLRQIYPEQVLEQIYKRFHTNSGEKHASENVNSTVRVNLPVFGDDGQLIGLSDRAQLKLSLFGNFPVKGGLIDLLFDYAVGEPVLNALQRLRKGKVTLPDGQELPTAYYHGKIAVRARMKKIGSEELSELVFQESHIDLAIGEPQTYFVIDIVSSDPHENGGFPPGAYDKIKQRYEDLKVTDKYTKFIEETEAELNQGIKDPDRKAHLETYKAYLEGQIAALRKKIRGEGTREESVKGKQSMGLGGTVKFVKETGGFVKYSNARDSVWHDGSVKNGLAPGEQGWWKNYDGAHIRIYLPAHVLVDFDRIVDEKTQSGMHRMVYDAGNTQKIMRDAIDPIPVTDDVFGNVLPPDSIWPSDEWEPTS